MLAARWTPWRRLQPVWLTSEPAFVETLGGGQAFRWENTGTFWQGIWGRHLARLRWSANGVEWSGPDGNTGTALAAYLGQVHPVDMSDVLPWRSDPRLAAAIKRWEGLRILKQPFGETLLCFLCSSTKRIPQITEICHRMATLFGEVLTDDLYALPTWERLADIQESDLRQTGMGYRARYISQTAQYLAGRPGWLEETEGLSYAEAKVRLMMLAGVGEKIADCALLFGAGKLEAFPVDTWMLKAMNRLYGLHGWKPEQIAHFGRVHFGQFAGYAQQLLFAGERNGLE